MSRVPTHNELLTAQGRLQGKVYRTPVLRNDYLDAVAGARLWLKAECLQHIGAFKARGALNTVSQVPFDELKLGLVTYSSGNHAQAVAWVAQMYSVKATIFMPTNAPSVKVDAAKSMGAEIVAVGTTSLERQQAARDFVEENGGYIVEPFDHPDTIIGQGTATLELREEVAARTKGAVLDQLFVPVGGGGLIAGACLALEGQHTEIIAVEPEGCDSMGKSLEAGEIVAVEPGPTLADGLKPTQIGELNFAMCKDRVSQALTVDDEEIRKAMIALWMRCKVVVEPSGAAALAGAVKASQAGANVGVLLSGGNVAPSLVAQLLA